MLADNLIRKYSLTRFFTLTVDRTYDVETTWRTISSWWSVMRKRLKRYASKIGVDFKFFAILECHKDGYPHIHGFWNMWIDQKELSVMWSECAPGKVVHVRTVDDSKSAADYLWQDAARYIGKQQAIDGARKIQSRGRTMWRSVGLKSDYELHKKALTEESDTAYTRVWTIERRDLMKMPVRSRDYGKANEREDLERTCSPSSESRAVEGFQVVEAREEASLGCEEDKRTPGEAEECEHGDKETEELIGSILDIFEGKVVKIYGYSQERNEGYPASIQSG